MKSLLLAVNIASIFLINSCGNQKPQVKSANESSSDTLQGNTDYTKANINVQSDSATTKKSEMQNSNAQNGNNSNLSNADTTKIIHSHGSPNQQQLDSVINAKTKKK